VYTLLPASFKRFLELQAMGKLTTHVLDTANGCPAAGMIVTLYKLEDGTATQIKQITLNHDGRADAPLLEGAAFVPGRYRLVFGVAAYFRKLGATLSDPPFLDEVPLDFGLATIGQHYHVPLLASPFA
jgi:5-hydroxyisourate hydrolase